MVETILYLLFRLFDTIAPAMEPAFQPTLEQAGEPRVAQARELRYPELRRLFAQAGLPYPPRQILLRLFKDLDILELWVQSAADQPYVHLKDYAVCARSGELGPKRRRGDLQVPEGFYRVTAFHPQSMFHLSLRINYPNASDRMRAAGADPGGDILIHGECCTIGCVPITNPFIEELYLIALDAYARHRRWAEVHMFPGRLDEAGMARLAERYASRRELVDFWRELQPGYTLFEEQRRPPKVTVDNRGRYRISPAPAPGSTRTPPPVQPMRPLTPGDR
jgi:murein L,D-transpeptidase YafK